MHNKKGLSQVAYLKCNMRSTESANGGLKEFRKNLRSFDALNPEFHRPYN